VDLIGGNRLRKPEIWIAGVVFALGAGALLLAGLRPWAQRSVFEFGLLHTVGRYDLALPLVGLGFVLAEVSGRIALVGGATLVAGLSLGGALEGAVVSATAADGDLFRYVFLATPACLIAVGLTLVLPGRVRVVLAPVAAFVAGAVLGLEIRLNDPSLGTWVFSGGAAFSGLWAVAAPLLLWRALAWRWLPTAGRICGSWMIAIGALLAALYLLPSQKIASPEAFEPSASTPPKVPDPAAPPGSPLSPPATSAPGLPDQVY
jgi:hypothetical protein